MASMWGRSFTVMPPSRRKHLVAEPIDAVEPGIQEIAGARHVVSRLMRESLVDRDVIAATESPQIRILPWANVVKIGGRSIIDRGREALLPLIDEIAGNLDRHKLIIGAGAGV